MGEEAGDHQGAETEVTLEEESGLLGWRWAKGRITYFVEKYILGGG